MTPVQYFNTETKQKRKKKFRADHISIKKKALKYENEVLKCQELVKNAPYEYGDRFIPRRYMYGHQISAHSSFNLNHSDEDLDIFDLKACKGYWRLHSHCHNVKVILGLDIEQDVLQLHDWITQSMCRRSLNNLPIVDSIAMLQRNAGGLDWPCKPRPIPLAYNDSTHDLPEFHRYSHYNIIAWSSQGKIAASFGRDLVLWGPPSTKTRQKITTVYRVGLVRTLAFNHHGTLLALGVYDVAKSKLQIYQLIQEKSDYAGDSLFNKEGICEIGQYIIHKSGIDDIRAIEWDPHENYIMCGMFSGTVHMIKYPLEPPPQLATCTSLPNIKTCDHHAKNCISNIKYSLKRTYIAIVDYGGNLSIRRRKKFKEIYHALKDVDFFSWHPWNEKDLFIASSLPAMISIFDLSTKTVLAYYQRYDVKCSLDAMTINPLSAELVVSFTREDRNGSIGCEILVLGSMNRVVDNLSAHVNSVSYLLWDPNGTHIATAGNDETLNIWNFFGMSQRKANELMLKKENGLSRSKFDLHNVFLDSR